MDDALEEFAAYDNALQEGVIKKPYRVYKITDPDTCVILARGKSWCVRHHNWAVDYLGAGPLFMFTKGNKPHSLITFAKKEWRDTKNEELSAERRDKIFDALGLESETLEEDDEDYWQTVYEKWLEENEYELIGYGYLNTRIFDQEWDSQDRCYNAITDDINSFVQRDGVSESEREQFMDLFGEHGNEQEFKKKPKKKVLNGTNSRHMILKKSSHLIRNGWMKMKPIIKT